MSPSARAGGLFRFDRRLVSQPPLADLIVEPKPLLSEDALNSDKALNDYDAAIEAWGERATLQIGRLCRWAKANKLPHPDCPG